LGVLRPPPHKKPLKKKGTFLKLRKPQKGPNYLENKNSPKNPLKFWENTPPKEFSGG